MCKDTPCRPRGPPSSCARSEHIRRAGHQPRGPIVARATRHHPERSVPKLAAPTSTTWRRLGRNDTRWPRKGPVPLGMGWPHSPRTRTSTGWRCQGGLLRVRVWRNPEPTVPTEQTAGCAPEHVAPAARRGGGGLRKRGQYCQWLAGLPQMGHLRMLPLCVIRVRAGCPTHTGQSPSLRPCAL